MDQIGGGVDVCIMVLWSIWQSRNDLIFKANHPFQIKL